MDVVTGAAGFIGSHLVDRLLDGGAEVVGLDSFDDYYDRPAKERNLAAARSRDGYRFVEGDLLHVDLDSLLSGTDRLFHLAAQPGVRGSWGPQFDRYARNNILSTQRLLEAARRARTGRIIYASSSSIYGEQSAQPTSELAIPRPISPYGVTKLAAEHMVHLYGKEYGIPTVALRLFTVYGPRQRPDMAFHKFIQSILCGTPIVLYGAGRWRRDFTFVGDIVDGFRAAADRAEPGTTFNLGRGSPVPLLDAVETLEKVSGRKIDVQMGTASGGEPASTWSDSHYAADRLGYHPHVDLEEGLRLQWEWQSKLIPAQSSSGP